MKIYLHTSIGKVRSLTRNLDHLGPDDEVRVEVPDGRIGPDTTYLTQYVRRADLMEVPE
jgi:hypothetical protein